MISTAQKVRLTSELQYLNVRLRDGRAVLQDKFSMKRIGIPDPAYQPRVIHLDMDHVKVLDDIYQAREYLDPIVIVHVPGTDRYILVDGFHRHEVYKRAKEVSIPAYVIEGTEDDAKEYSALANQHAILKRTSKDIKKQVYMLLGIEEWFGRNDSEISRHVGVKGSAVTKYRASFCQETGRDFPVSFTYVRTRDGRRQNIVCRKTGGVPAITKHGKQYRATIARKHIPLGNEINKAQVILAEKMADLETRKATICNRSFFSMWLPPRGVSLNASAIPASTYPCLGESAHGLGVIVIESHVNDPKSIYLAIGRLYSIREILNQPGSRLACACYPDVGSEGALDVGRRLGVEFLTPDQLVASIKGES